MNKLKMHTPNKVDENIEKIGALFPNCLTERIIGYKEEMRSDGTREPIVEAAIDFDMLRQELSSIIVEGNEERYQFTWPDKKKAVVLANTSITDTVRLNRKKSVGRNGVNGNIDSENIYIEGDNLNALKLLREPYLGKIKMIYIDPPYNTGTDTLIYDDDFTASQEEFSMASGQYNQDGKIMFDMRLNNESNGRFHTDWLNMLYARLRIAKDLLSDDGLIFTSIDEHEIENCLKVFDEIWGRNNRVGVIIIKSNPRGSMAIGEIANLHEYLVIYAKNYPEASIVGHMLSESMEDEYKYEDEKGKYRLLGLRMRGGFWRRGDRPNLYFPLYVNPMNGAVSLSKTEVFSEEALPVQPSTMEDGTWRWSTEKIKENLDDLVGRKVKRGDIEKWDIYQKDYYEREGGRRTKAKSIWDAPEINYQNGTAELKKLFKAEVFDYSKPPYLIEKAIEMVGFDEGDIVLDFFSGSATTAQAVLNYNAENTRGKLKYIMVQLPEKCNEKSGAFNAGYKTICEVGEERIRRAGQLIKNEKASDIDYGFRVFEIAETNMKDVYYNPSELTMDTLFGTADNIKEDRTPEDLLFQVMLDLGVLLSSKIEEIAVGEKKIFNVADGYLIACFDANITDEVITEIAKKKPYYFVMRDSSMASDSVAANFDQIFATYSPETVRKVL